MFKNWILAIAPMVITSIQSEETPKTSSNYIMVENLAKTPLLNPSLQKRSIAKVRLSNGIEAYIVSDPEAKHSAMSVSVKAGSWDDPKEYPGMAHFVEHVLFMGTKTYPEENDYTKHITESAGTYNAYTSTDRTVYMFAVNHDGFEGALDRLAHFFIDPLLCTSSIERELHAVDQEHAKNLENDNWRQWMILKELSNPDHPHVKFSTGNADTLRGIPESVMRTWFNQNYTPEHMRVVVVSPLATNTLVDLIVSKFSLVHRDNLESRIPLDPEIPVLSAAQQGALVSIQPIRDMKELALLWELPPAFRSLEAEGTLHFLTYLLDSPHEGGLIDLLKQKGWIQESKSSFDRFSDATVLFSINYTLTEEGVRNRDQIFEITFQALNKIANEAPFECFDEMKRLHLVHYQYQTRQNAFETVAKLGHKMFDEPLSTFPEKSMLPEDLSQDLFQELLLALKPAKACFLLTADEKFSAIKPNCKEHWMNAEYALIPYSDPTLTAWDNASPSAISLKMTNPFIPEHLELLGQTTNTFEPELALQTDQASIHYLKDNFYQVPELSVSYRIHTPLIDGSARSIALAELLCSAYNDRLHSTLHMAKVAGLSAIFHAGPYYLQLSLSGYSEKMSQLAEILFASKQLHTPKERFLVLKEQLLSRYANASKELPFMQGTELMDSLLITATPQQMQKCEELKTIEYEDFLGFSQSVFDKIYLEGLVFGNCTQQTAVNLSSSFLLALDADVLPKEQIMKRKVRLLPNQEGPYVVAESTPSLGEATLLAIQQGPYSYDRRARQMIAGKYLQEFFFDRLRTKQQTGYMVRARDFDLEGQLIQLFIVQSSSHHTQELLARFDLFLDEVNQEFDTLVTKESFMKTRSMTLAELKLPPENMQNMAIRLSTLAFDYYGAFDYYPKLIQSVENLQLEDLKAFVHETLSRKNTRRLAVLVEGKMQGKRPFIYRKVAKEELSAIGELESRRYR